MNRVDISGWGDTPPQWICQLSAMVEEQGSIKATAERLDVSRTSVSLLLRNDYTASTEKMQATVEAFFSRVNCPVLGEVSNERCQNEREKPFIGSNPMRIQLYRACQRCPNNPMRETHDDH